MNNTCYPFINTPLPYDYDSLEPFIDEKTMHLHHDKHLQTYIDNLNTILENHPTLQNYTLEQLVMNWCRFPCNIKTSIRNNAGGVYNHRFFFDGMSPSTDMVCNYNIIYDIEQSFCGMDNFMKLFKAAALSVFGSGYAWLVIQNGKFEIITTANQNTPNLNTQYPLLNIDVWEHAYYLKYYNVRASYIDNWFHIINWESVENRYMNILGQYHSTKY